MADPALDTSTVTITPYRDGPYLVRGAFRVLDQDGREISPGRRTIALCRCGKSRMRPFCDGTHRITGFRASGADERVLPTRPSRYEGADDEGPGIAE